jgi:hypothetical protein
MQRKDFMIPLRSFLEIVTGSGILLALGDLGFLARLPSFSAAKVALEPRMGRFHPEIEPRVRLIEEMARNRVLEEVTRRVKHGLNYRELLPRLLLAGRSRDDPEACRGKQIPCLLLMGVAGNQGYKRESGGKT